jgi:CubicO group peptidase (beta-lactamase class C family)
MRARRYALACWTLITVTCLTVRAGELAKTTPEDVGLSSSKLDRVKQVAQEKVDKKEFAGVVTTVVRRGKVAQLEAIGMMDIEAGKPMKPDTIFRIYSMSKPITTVAAMLLWEEGRFQLDDPVSQYIPELKGLRVHAGKGDETVEARREITIRDLMRHTSGLTYGAFGDAPVDKLYRAKRVLDPKSSLQDMVAKLSKIPLQDQPGTRFRYSVSTDVLGRLVEVVSGKSLDAFFEERIFKPLDMVDSAFFVPESKLDRFAANYGPDGKGGLKPIDVPAKSPYRSLPKLLSGGGGLVSTARDYTRFCQMLLNGGELEGTRLLRKETVQLMTTNQIPDEALPISPPTTKGPAKGLGFGLGFAVVMEPSESNPSAVIGEYYWGGAASTTFLICPKHETIIITLAQFMPFTPKLGEAVKPIVYGAIVDR